MVKPAWKKKYTQKRNILSFFGSMEDEATSSPPPVAATSTTTTVATLMMTPTMTTTMPTMTVASSINNDLTLNEPSPKSPKVSRSSSPGLMATIQSADYPISPGGDSGSNISLPSFFNNSNFSPQRQTQLTNSYLMGYRRAAAKCKAAAESVAVGGAMIPQIFPIGGGQHFGSGRWDWASMGGNSILAPEGGIGRPKDEEVVDMAVFGSIGRPKDEEEVDKPVSIPYFYLYICFNSPP